MYVRVTNMVAAHRARERIVARERVELGLRLTSGAAGILRPSKVVVDPGSGKRTFTLCINDE